jgi:hypothetical protein
MPNPLPSAWQHGEDQPPIATGGGPPHDGHMEARVARLEASVGHIQTDIADLKQDLRDFRRSVDTRFLWLLGAYAAGFIVLLGTMAHGFGWL